MNEFSPYEKMPTSLKKLGLSESDIYQIGKLKWVVTEKVHGANFSFVYEDGNLKFAKRKEYLKWTDDFFGFQLVVKNLEENILQLFEALSSRMPAKKYMLFGELFGGEYPHPDIAAIPELNAIQTGVYYHPDINFCAFDLAIESEDPDSKQYLDYETSLSYFKEFGIFHAKPLFTGKLTDALNFNLRMNSPIPQEFNLPPLKQNLIEGVVVKPFNKLDPDLIPVRPIIKLKNPEFDEEEKYHEAEKWSFIPKVSSHTEDLSFIVDELRTYINRNRLESAISKIGELDFSNANRIAEIKTEILEDALTDFNQNNNRFLADMTADSRKWINDRILSEINLLLTRYQQ